MCVCTCGSVRGVRLFIELWAYSRLDSDLGDSVTNDKQHFSRGWAILTITAGRCERKKITPSEQVYFCLPMKYHFSLPRESLTATAKAMLGSRGLTSQIDPTGNRKRQAYTCCHLIVFSIISPALKDAAIGLWSVQDNSQLVTIPTILVSRIQGWWLAQPSAEFSNTEAE